jgi:hypothetical protein
VSLKKVDNKARLLLRTLLLLDKVSVVLSPRKPSLEEFGRFGFGYPVANNGNYLDMLKSFFSLRSKR